MNNNNNSNTTTNNNNINNNNNNTNINNNKTNNSAFDDEFNYTRFKTSPAPDQAHLSNMHLSLLSTWEAFQSVTTSHGIPQFGRAKGIFKRVLWFLSTLACVVALGYNTYLLTSKFTSYDVSVSVQLNHAKRMEFPAVTICNNNPMKYSSFMMNQPLRGIMNDYNKEVRSFTCEPTPAYPMVSPDPNVPSPNPFDPSATGETTIATATNDADTTTSSSYYAGPLGATIAFNDTTFYTLTTVTGQPTNDANSSNVYNNTTPDNVTTTANATTSRPYMCFPYFGVSDDGRQQRSDYRLFNQVMEQFMFMTEQEKINQGHLLQNMVFDCNYAGGNSRSDFSYFFNNYHGNCYTFNSAMNLDQNSSLKVSGKAGPRYGLSIVFNVEQEEYIGEITQSAGLRVVVHDPRRMPFPEDEGILVSPNALTHIGVSMTKTNKLNGVYGNCRSEDETQKNRTMYQVLFNTSYCEKGCLYTCLNEEIIKSCGCVDIKFPLLDSNNTKLIPCSVDNTSLSLCAQRVWQAYENGTLPCSSTCTIPCRETLYKPVISRGIWPSNNYLTELGKTPFYTSMYYDLIFGSKNYGQMIVYIQDFSYTSIVESPAYEIQQFSSDIGGILGLYIGFSILTIVEFFELAMDVLGIVGYQAFLNAKSAVKSKRNENKIKKCNRVKPFKGDDVFPDEDDELDMDPSAMPRTGATYTGPRSDTKSKQDMTPVHM